MGEIQRRGIETRLGVKPHRFEADRIITDQGEFAADLIVWMPGMTGQPWFDRSPLPRSPGGLIAADERCRVGGLERVYAVGDAGSHAGPEWLPKQAHSADLHAEVAARNLIAELRGGAASRVFHPELVCVVDTGERGMMITRSARRAMALPPWRAVHWAKRMFKWNYLRKYR
jgi:sulfide:quinone oxidoreductase